MLTLSYIVLSAAIVLLFLDEFIRLFKKIYAIPGVEILAPLVLASSLVELYEEGGLWLLLWCQDAIHRAIHFLAEFSPFKSGVVSLIQIVYLLILAILPAGYFTVKAKFQKRYPPSSFTFAYYLGLTLWIIGVVLLTVPSESTWAL